MEENKDDQQHSPKGANDYHTMESPAANESPIDQNEETKQEGEDLEVIEEIKDASLPERADAGANTGGNPPVVKQNTQFNNFVADKIEKEDDEHSEEEVARIPQDSKVKANMIDDSEITTQKKLKMKELKSALKAEEKRIKLDVTQLLNRCHKEVQEPYAILELDLKYFCTEALSSLLVSDIEFQPLRVEAGISSKESHPLMATPVHLLVSSLLQIVKGSSTCPYDLLNEDDSEDGESEEEGSGSSSEAALAKFRSLERTLKVQASEDVELSLVNNDLSTNYLAALCLWDISKNRDWLSRVFQRKEYLPTIRLICKELIAASFQDYSLRNLQSKIVAQFFQILFLNFRQQSQLLTELIEEVDELISEGDGEEDFFSIDFALRTLSGFVSKVEDEHELIVKDFHVHVPHILSSILSAFSNEDIGVHGREQILNIMFLCLRCVSWADGIDNELVHECLDDTFNQWMAVFLQIIQSDAKKMFEIKRNALRCLTVIFRDFLNYSRECINMILRPSWKLLNLHLPIFTEALCYNKPFEEIHSSQLNNSNHDSGSVENPPSDQASNEDSEEDESANRDALVRGYESDEEDEREDPRGIQGMTLQLIELLTTLVQRPNVQEVVRQGLIPLLMTVSSYMIVEHASQREYLADENYFLYDKTQTIFKTRSIRNQCIDLFSSLIDRISRDQVIHPLMLVIDSLLEINTDSPSRNPTEESKDSSENSAIETANSSRNDDRANLKEFSYMSNNEYHIWKRKDVAIILLGLFIEDVQMYSLRNPNFSLVKLLQEIISIPFGEAKQMSTYLKGRALWCASTCADSLIVPNDQTNKLKDTILDLSIDTLAKCRGSDHPKSIKLVSTRCMVKVARRIQKQSLQEYAPKFETILDDLLVLLDDSKKEVLYLPINAFQTFSTVNQDTVSQMAPKITPKLLQIFKTEHSEGILGEELMSLFKQWSQYDTVRHIFINTFVPFIMEIIEAYYNATPNEENKDTVLQLCSLSESLSLDSSNEKQRPGVDQKPLSIVDSTILKRVLELLCNLLKQTDKSSQPEEFKKIIAVFPQLLKFVHKTEDMFLLLHGTTALKNFIFLGHKEILEICEAPQIVDVAKRLLLPSTNEGAALCLGNLVIQIFHKIQPQIDTSVLFSVVEKIYKTRIPSALQSLILIFSRLVHTNPSEIVEHLSDTSVNSRICLKIVLDKWLLQQPLFRGTYTRTVTLTALLKLFMMRDSRIESLMVIGYNPSHSNINSEVNAPFKILSTLLRFIENEEITGGPKKNFGPGADPYDDDGERPIGGAFGNFSMPRREFDMSNERLDTMENYYDQYGDEDIIGEMQDDDDEENDLSNRQELEMDDDDEDDEDLLGQEEKSSRRKLNSSQEQLEVHLDDIEDEEDQECLLGGKQNEMNKKKDAEPSSDKKMDWDTISNSSNLSQDLFKVKESQDKGLADQETGSEIYMSELLDGFDMDFDEADEQNEEDLMLLGDSFADVPNLKEEILSKLRLFITNKEKYKHGRQYIQYCMRQLHDDDLVLAKRYLVPFFKQQAVS